MEFVVVFVNEVDVFEGEVFGEAAGLFADSATAVELKTPVWASVAGTYQFPAPPRPERA